MKRFIPNKNKVPEPSKPSKLSKPSKPPADGRSISYTFTDFELREMAKEHEELKKYLSPPSDTSWRNIYVFPDKIWGRTT